MPGYCINNILHGLLQNKGRAKQQPVSVGAEVQRSGGEVPARGASGSVISTPGGCRATMDDRLKNQKTGVIVDRLYSTPVQTPSVRSSASARSSVRGKAGGQMRMTFHQLSPQPAAGCRAFSLAQSETLGLLAYRLPLQQGEDHLELGVGQPDDPFSVGSGPLRRRTARAAAHSPAGWASSAQDRSAGSSMDVAQTIRTTHLIASRRVCHSQMAGLRLRINIGNGGKASSK